MTGTNEIYEIRIKYQSNFYRVFCCFDEGQLVDLFNGFQKKTQKTPLKEIKKAEQLIKDYFNNGQIGTESRNKYEEGAQMFIISEMLKAARKGAKLTQEQLAEKAGTKKS